MSKTISLRDANQGFSRCIREVQGGEEFVITRDGVPVAKLIPFSPEARLSPERAAALERLERHWAQVDSGVMTPQEIGPFDRDALHER